MNIVGELVLKKTLDKTTYFFVDESGDTTFYDRHGNFIVNTPGCSPILIMGFVSCEEPKIIRMKLKELREQLINDPYLQGISSLEKTKIAFHAKDDCPEVRQPVFKLISTMDIKAQLVVARKTESIYNKFDGNTNKLYDHLITVLFKDKLHTSSENRIYFATRGNRKRQKPLEDAIHNARKAFEGKWQTCIGSQINILAQIPSDEPCLQVVDYINWTVYRAYTTGEMRYFNAIRDKVSLLVDLYDANQPKWQNFYNRKNPFEVKKTSPL
jgi:hypothetical protein